MLTTYDRDKWVEDTVFEHIKDRITQSTPEDYVRGYFPYKAVIKGRCIAYSLKEGEVIPYVRVRHKVTPFPIEGITYGMQGIEIKTLFFNSDEAQLVEV